MRSIMRSFTRRVMRRHVFTSLTVAAVGLLASQASAADLVPVYKTVPVAPPPLTWTGFYLGGNLGAGFGDKWWNAGNCPFFCLPFEGVFSGQSLGTTSMDGFLGGLQGGYNWQYGPWVFGIEGTFEWTDMHGQFPFEGTNDQSRLEWIATVVGRVGVTIDRALVYAGGGAAWTRENNTVNFPGDEAELDLSGNDTPFGFTFLTGVEYAIDPHWSARIQYNFYDFGSKSLNMNFTNALGIQEEGVSAMPLSTQLRIHSITAGVNYRFWAF
jgi:outer membrane immunogenic protein